MKTIKIIKWGSLFLSVLCFAAISFIPKNIRQENIENKIIPNQKKQQQESQKNEEPLTDCNGIINAYEKQRDKSTKSLTENYNNCIEFGQPNPPSQKTKVKKPKKK